MLARAIGATPLTVGELFQSRSTLPRSARRDLTYHAGTHVGLRDDGPRAGAQEPGREVVDPLVRVVCEPSGSPGSVLPLA